MELALSEAGRRIIDAVIDAPVAWRSPGELAIRLGWPLERTLDEIADLDSRGWLEAWELVDGPVVTLSLAATTRCGVRLIEVGHDETPKWARQGDPDPPVVPALGVFRGESMARLHLVADGRPGVEHQAMVAEDAEAHSCLRDDGRAADRLAHLPRPTLLIGGGLSPWPGPGQADGAICPACRSARLPARAYCLWCDRWGLDRELVEPIRARGRSRRPSFATLKYEDDMLRRDEERRKRRAKRKERRKKQARSCGAPAGRPESRRLGPLAG